MSHMLWILCKPVNTTEELSSKWPQNTNSSGFIPDCVSSEDTDLGRSGSWVWGIGVCGEISVRLGWVACVDTLCLSLLLFWDQWLSWVCPFLVIVEPNHINSLHTFGDSAPIDSPHLLLWRVAAFILLQSQALTSWKYFLGGPWQGQFVNGCCPHFSSLCCSLTLCGLMESAALASGPQTVASALSWRQALQWIRSPFTLYKAWDFQGGQEVMGLTHCWRILVS